MKAKNKTALIIGSQGQDGKLLTQLLTGLNYKVIGVDKNGIDIQDRQAVFTLIKKNKPEEIYYLAAFHFSSQDKQDNAYNDLYQSYQINVLALLNFLEGIRLFSPKTKIFYASSSLIFGNSKTKIQNENTPYNPNSAYGITKMNGALLCKLYREKYNIFASVGILYNHESKYRADNFISMKIIKGAINIKSGKQDKLIVGDLSAKVDWGYAPDYVKAMQLILNNKQADDFIIATGKLHTVLDFIKITFKTLGLNYKKYIKENKKIINERKAVLLGDAKKLKAITGWKASVNFSQMIKKIINNLD
jgi:GDPmannose 4,6-dehydratase